MPGETTRRIICLGGSGVIALPSDYRRYHHLDPGVEVKVLYDSLVLVVPPCAEYKLKEKEDLIRRLLE